MIRRTRRTALALAALLAFLAAPAAVRAEPPDPISKPKLKVHTEPDLTYYKVDGKEMKLDLAMPAEGKGPFPAVVCLHGGAWRMGSRKDLSKPSVLFNKRSLIEELASEGYVAVSVSYRLAPDAKFPAQIEDCKTAVRWLRANANKYHIDPKRIGAVGFSAGGHLCCLLGCTDKSCGFEGSEYGECSSRVQAVVSFFGPTDLTYYSKDESAINAVFTPWLGCAFKDRPEVYKNASPINHVTKDDPPFLFIHGDKDILVPIDQSRTMCEKLKKVGVRAEMIEMKGQNHGWIGDPARRSTDATLRFFAEHLKR